MTKILTCSEVWGGGEAVDTHFRLPGFDGALFSRPASGSAGGDIYLISSCNMGMVCKVVLADIAGHGEQVTEAGRMLADLLRDNVAERDNDRFLIQLNLLFEARRFDPLFATLACGTYFTQTRQFSFAYAGHPQIIHGRDGQFRPLDLALGSSEPANNIPIGIVPDADFQQGHIELQIGDWLLFCTDGLLEARNENGQEYGLARMLADIHRLAGASAMAMKNGLLTRVRDFVAPRQLDQDDLTLVVLTLRDAPPRPMVRMSPEIEQLLERR